MHLVTYDPGSLGVPFLTHLIPSPYPSETGARRALRYGEGMIEGETERNPCDESRKGTDQP